MAKTKVTYRGFSDERVLPYEALKGLEAHAGLPEGKDLVFTRRGPLQTQEIELNDRLKDILQKDGGFEILEAGVEATSEAPAETVVDENTGQVDKRK